ncbi:glycosyltransferase [Methyloterricola oryzae]|uniref:glycosyltransferase n=1 Tax=Methyloterricola oryzae TaxID=1495050 RepID=UPI0005EBB2A9|nr:glycosyltransferase [Methyloterricola oryzae]
MTSVPAGRRLAVLAAFSGQGGVEKMVSNLLAGFADQGIAVDLLPVVRAQRHMPDCPPSTRVIELGTRHTALAVPAIARYLRQERPAVLLAVRDRGIRSALLARRLSGIAMPIVGNLHTNLSAALQQRGPLTRWWRLRSARASYRALQRIIAVSEGVAADTRRLAELPGERVVAIPNPVLTQDFQQRAAEPPPPGILPAGDAPLIVGSGRLTRQKDFPTLIRAFAQVRAQRPCHLLILGEGGLRPELEALVHALRLKDAVSLPGFLDNPFPCMAAARLFVLSSRWEGSGNVITEALALGVPAVSTDCPSGPAEILGYGRFGRLTPVGDVSALAEAMLATLDDPLPAQVLRDAVADYSVTRSAARYLEVLGF